MNDMEEDRRSAVRRIEWGCALSTIPCMLFVASTILFDANRYFGLIAPYLFLALVLPAVCGYVLPLVGCCSYAKCKGHRKSWLGLVGVLLSPLLLLLVVVLLPDRSGKTL